MPTVTAFGRTIQYLESPGDGPPIVLVHSSGLDRRQWGALRLVLPGQRRILAPNLVGYGESAPFTPGTPFSMDDDVEVVLAMLEAAGEPVVLVGHSYGGYLAMRAALHSPERVRALLVHEPVIWGVIYDRGDPAQIAEVERATADGRFLSPEHGGKEPWWRRFVEIWGGEGAWDALPPERRQAFLDVGAKVFEEVRALVLDRTTAQEWARLEMPVVITVGEGTQRLEAAACEIVAEAMPSARLIDIPGGHMAPLVAPEAFGGVLVQLLEDLEERSAPP